MPSEYISLVLGMLAVILFFLLVFIVSFTFGYRALRDIERRLDAMIDDSGAPPATLVPKLPRLSRRMPEPEPGGTKVYPNSSEVWDQGLERTDV